MIQYDFGKTVKEGKFIQTSSLNKPPAIIMTALSKLRAKHRIKRNAIITTIKAALESHEDMRADFERPGPDKDTLFNAAYEHAGSAKDCTSCNGEEIVHREPRASDATVVHYGLIGSANQVMRHGATREKLRRENNIICFEMEAAGLMDTFPCIVIRGICDYADTHKNKRWQGHAAIAAAAYAKELLACVSSYEVPKMPKAVDALKDS